MYSFLRSISSREELGPADDLLVAGGALVDLRHDPDPLVVDLLRRAHVLRLQAVDPRGVRRDSAGGRRSREPVCSTSVVSPVVRRWGCDSSHPRSVRVWIRGRPRRARARSTRSLRCRTRARSESPVVSRTTRRRRGRCGRRRSAGATRSAASESQRSTKHDRRVRALFLVDDVVRTASLGARGPLQALQDFEHLGTSTGCRQPDRGDDHAHRESEMRAPRLYALGLSGVSGCWNRD